MIDLTNKRLFVFDFDGVLADSVDVKTQAFASMFASHGAEVQGWVVNHHLENGGMSRFNKFRVYHRHIHGEELDEETLSEYIARFSALVVDAVVAAEAIPGAEQVLQYCTSKGIDSIVNSGTPEVELNRIIERRGWLKYFKHILGSPASKEANLKRALDLSNCTPDRAVMFGDSTSDLDAALALGVEFVAINAHETLDRRSEAFTRCVDMNQFMHNLS